MDPIPLDDLPPCIFEPGDAWFGKSFIGDELYKNWYYEFLSILYDPPVTSTNEEDHSEEEEEYFEESW